MGKAVRDGVGRGRRTPRDEAEAGVVGVGSDGWGASSRGEDMVGIGLDLAVDGDLRMDGDDVDLPVGFARELDPNPRESFRSAMLGPVTTGGGCCFGCDLRDGERCGSPIRH